MSSPHEIKKRQLLNDAFLAGEKICGIRFRFNSHIAFIGAEDIHCEGWVVGVELYGPEPIYTIERCDGGGDEEVPESKIELILDPHELSST